MSCELPPFTLLRTEHGNVIARDNRDNQEFVFAECYSTAIAALILAAVTLYTERKAYEKTPPLIAPVRERWLFPLPQPDTVFSGEALLPPPVLSTEGRCPCCRRTVTHRFILEDSWPLQQMADTCRDTVVLLEKTSPG